MAARHDYASKAPAKGGKKAAGKKPVPGWIWLIAGLVIGLFIAFIVYLQQQPKGTLKLPKLPSIEQKQDARTVKKEPPPKAPEKTQRDDGIEFNFYDILPNYEVAIPEKELEQPIREGAQASDYLLQAGSFRQAKDADARRAQLALLGISSEVRSITSDRGTWHRVVVGPFDTRMELDKMRRRMQDNQIDVLLIRQKK